ncbi:MAG: hypothetical protein Q9190_002120 [Brigantiaea leucoxantha]
MMNRLMRKNKNEPEKDMSAAFIGSENTRGTTDPPPSFAVFQQQSSTQHVLPGSSFQAYPIQPHHTPVPLRTLRTRYTSWKCTGFQVSEGNESMPLYDVKIKWFSKPTMAFKSGDGVTTIGTANFHALSSKIDITIGDDKSTITSQGLLSCQYHFPSSAGAGSALTWRARKSASEFLCMDEAGIQIARYKYSSSGNGGGTIEIFGERATSGRGLDELVISGVALRHAVMIAATSAAAAGGAGA